MSVVEQFPERGRTNAVRATKVHAISSWRTGTSATKALCGVSPITSDTRGCHGRWHRTNEAIDCGPCVKALLADVPTTLDPEPAMLAEISTITTTTLQVALPIPTVAGELEKAIGVMRQRMTSYGLHVVPYTCFRVEADGEHIYLRATIPNNEAPAETS